MSVDSRLLEAPAATFRFGEFIFDCESRQLIRSGVRRHLSPKAQQLLHLLLQARPRALSREELYDALWPSTFVCETNLASIVNEVRRALGDDARSAHYIRTVHGFGYAFSGEVGEAPPPTFVVAMLFCSERRYPLYEGENSIGRWQDCRVVLPDVTVSRRHALITVAEGSGSVRDLDSKNGTYVDGQRVGRLPVAVTKSAVITFGSVGASIMFLKTSSTDSLQLNMTELRRQVAERITSA